MYSVLVLMGPRARDVLEKAAPHEDVSDAAFPFGVSKHIGIGLAPVRAARVTYVGERGWELYLVFLSFLFVSVRFFRVCDLALHTGACTINRPLINMHD